MTCKQIKLPEPACNVEMELVHENILPRAGFQNFYICTYDVESLMISPDVDFVAQNLDSIHRLVTIAVKSNLPVDDEKCFIRKDMGPNSLKILINEFVDWLTITQKKMTEALPSTIIEGYKKYCDMIMENSFKKKSPNEKNKILAKHTYLRSILNLRCYGWNSEKYDVNMLLTPLIDNFAKNENLFQKMRTIRRGTGFMELQYGQFVFRDFMNYSVPMTLDSFAKSCDVTEVSKTTFPYEYYHSVAELYEERNFPNYCMFVSSLRKTGGKEFVKELIDITGDKLRLKKWKTINDIEKYYDIKIVSGAKMENDELKIEEEAFESVRSQLHTSPAKYEQSKNDFIQNHSNMASYLKEYNLNDVRLLLAAIESYSKGYKTQFGINIHESMSLPGRVEVLRFIFPGDAERRRRLILINFNFFRSKTWDRNVYG